MPTVGENFQILKTALRTRRRYGCETQDPVVHKAVGAASEIRLRRTLKVALSVCIGVDIVSQLPDAARLVVENVIAAAEDEIAGDGARIVDGERAVHASCREVR